MTEFAPHTISRRTQVRRFLLSTWEEMKKNSWNVMMFFSLCLVWRIFLVFMGKKGQFNRFGLSGHQKILRMRINQCPISNQSTKMLQALTHVLSNLLMNAFAVEWTLPLFHFFLSWMINCSSIHINTYYEPVVQCITFWLFNVTFSIYSSFSFVGCLCLLWRSIRNKNCDT